MPDGRPRRREVSQTVTVSATRREAVSAPVAASAGTVRRGCPPKQRYQAYAARSLTRHGQDSHRNRDRLKHGSTRGQATGSLPSSPGSGIGASYDSSRHLGLREWTAARRVTDSASRQGFTACTGSIRICGTDIRRRTLVPVGPAEKDVATVRRTDLRRPDRRPHQLSLRAHGSSRTRSATNLSGIDDRDRGRLRDEYAYNPGRTGPCSDTGRPAQPAAPGHGATAGASCPRSTGHCSPPRPRAVGSRCGGQPRPAASSERVHRCAARDTGLRSDVLEFRLPTDPQPHHRHQPTELWS